MIKVSALIILVLLLPLFAHGQEISYAYDANGNRTERIIILKTRGVSLSDRILDSTYFHEQLSESQLRIYPNPVKFELTISLDNYDSSMRGGYSLYSMGGALLVKGDIEGGNTRLNMSSYAKGVYLLHIRLNERSTSWKVIKE